MDLDVEWVEVSLEVPVERHLEVLLLLSAAAEYFLEVYCLPVVRVLLLLSHWILLLLLLGMDDHLDRNDHVLLDHCCRLNHLVDH